MLSVVTPLADDYALYDDGKCTLQSTAEGGQLIVRLDDDKTLGRELRTYLQTDKYVGRKNDGTASTTTLKILRERQEENRERRQRLVLQLEQLCKEAGYYAAGQPVQPKSGAAAAALGEALNYLIRNSFNKLGYLTHLSANPQAEIKAVLSATDVDDLGFSLEAGQGNQQAISEVQDYVNLMAGANRQVILQDMVEDRFGRRPYGWPEWEVVLLVARLVRKGDISLVMDGATLSIDKIFEAVITPSKWRRITVIKRQTVDKGQLQTARNLAKDVFGKIAPDGEDELDAFLRENLGGWHDNLAQYKTLADTGDYPGSQEIADAQGVIAKLLAEKESFGLIGKFLERKDDLLDLSDDVHELENFYDTQRPTWEKLRKAYDRFQLNRTWLDKDATATAALQAHEGDPRRRRALRNDQGCRVTDPDRGRRQHRPGHEAPGPCPATHRRPHRQGRGGARCRPGIRRSAQPVPLSPADPEAPGRNPGQHRPHQSGPAERHRSRGRGVRQDRGRIERNPNGKKADGRQSGETTKTAPVYVKKRRIVQAAQLAPKGFLETQADIDDYLNKLRQALESAIKTTKRVEIR